MIRFILLLIIQFSFSQNITVYPTKEEALKGKVSSTEAIQKILDEKNTVVAPEGGGWLYVDDSIILRGDGWNFRGNGIKLVTDKPIAMFLPLGHAHKIKDFTAHFETSEKGGSVVRYGGDKRNTGRWYVNHLGTLVKNFRGRRTQCIGNSLDFDLKGFAIGVWINYEDQGEDKHSHCHFTDIKGTYYNVDTAIKINTRVRTQSINTLDINLKVWGAKKFAEINGVNHATIKIIGQELEPNDEPLFEISGHNIWADIFVYDVAKRNKANGYLGSINDKRAGHINVNGFFEIFGMMRTKTRQIKGKPQMTGINFYNTKVTNIAPDNISK